MSDLPFETKRYAVVRETWPRTGHHILATYDDSNIIVYQAFNDSIATYAVQNQTFINCPEYKTTRMTWIKTNFLWMMYRSGWATKSNQTQILAITIKRDGFEQILRHVALSNVRLQWDPDHDPVGTNKRRRAIQLGIKNKILDRFLTEWIVKIDNITPFVVEQRRLIKTDRLLVPYEKVYNLKDKSLANVIQLTR